jgi:hypothetical protein
MGGEGSGRPPVDVDMEAVLDLLSRGEKPPAIADIFGISAVTLRKRIADLQQKQGLLLQYRVIQSLQLTELQARVLEAITPQKINDAPLRDLVMSYKILKDKELNLEGKPSEIKGLVAHLIYMEKQESALKNGTPAPETYTDAQYDDMNPDDGNGECKDLALLDDQNF